MNRAPMRHSGLPSRLVAVALAGGLVLGACSDGSSNGDAEPATTTSTTEPEPTSTSAPGSSESGGSLTAGPGVDLESQTITLGVLADLSGPFASLTADVVDAHLVFWDGVNATGGVDGWTVDVEVADTRADPERHREQYAAMEGEVLAISQSTGSSANIGSLDPYISDERLVIPMR